MHVMGVIGKNQVCEKGIGKGTFNPCWEWLPWEWPVTSSIICTRTMAEKPWICRMNDQDLLVVQRIQTNSNHEHLSMVRDHWDRQLCERWKCSRSSFLPSFFDLCENMGLDLITFSRWIVRLNWVNCVSHVVPTMTSYEWDGNGFMRVLGPWLLT